MTACAWCPAEATTTVVLEPARMGHVTTNTMHGAQWTTAKAAIEAPACAACAEKADAKPGALRLDPRTLPAEGVQQTTIYDFLEDR